MFEKDSLFEKCVYFDFKLCTIKKRGTDVGILKCEYRLIRKKCNIITYFLIKTVNNQLFMPKTALL